MTLVLSAEHEALRATVREFLAATSPQARVREWMAADSGFDRDAWRLMAKQLGLLGLAVPEEFGGAGGSAVELGVVLEEMGRALVCAPFFATAVLARQALLGSGDRAAQQRYLPAIVSGELVATVAVAEDEGWDAVTLAATPGWSLTGTKSYVLDGMDADVVFTLARTPQGLGMFAVDTDAPGLVRESLPVLDRTRRLARMSFHAVAATPVGDPAFAGEVMRTVLDHAAAALAMEQAGGAARVLELAVDHAKSRFQFGRAIGSFQAVKHRCADMLVLVEQAKAVAYHAIAASATDADDLRLAAGLAKAFCSTAYTRVANENIQIHGGIGFTWEHPAHLYLKRAKSSELMFGDPARHRDAIGRALGV
ncbi:acyl-CoA dehydrogenase family protein [Kutzneria sp. NPDC052558]|uniref:acyl-CoA dehydrogenase family protein n=1 Tax=Kutzneria sp. NPDC052558 TaxID=3364121 RepID=UPI0037C99422